jgi:3-phosphoshikimate 1-carboxyvinyltransferase
MSPTLCIQPGSNLSGKVSLPGDKSLSHRFALFAALASGESLISGFLSAGVTHSLLNSLHKLGVSTFFKEGTLIVDSPGYQGFLAPQDILDCGNSATTMRLLAGAMAASNIPAILDGSEGLRHRPMNRIIEPLNLMGVKIFSTDGCAPIVIEKSRHPLSPITYELPVASAQVKSCLLISALAAKGETTLIEPGPSRDHTERLLQSLGIHVDTQVTLAPSPGIHRYVTRILPPKGWGSTWKFPNIHLSLPGDISSAAFLIVAALITPGSSIRLENVGLNPTRTGLLDVLLGMGADIDIYPKGESGGEPVGEIIVRHSTLTATTVSGPTVVRMIDEFPVFAIAAIFAEGTTIVKDAQELRHKEADRIQSMCEGLAKIGVIVEETEDGFVIKGSHSYYQKKGSIQLPLHFDPRGDHRLAMSFALLGLPGFQMVRVMHADIIHESFPEFVDILAKLGAQVKWEIE